MPALTPPEPVLVQKRGKTSASTPRLSGKQPIFARSKRRRKLLWNNGFHSGSRPGPPTAVGLRTPVQSLKVLAPCVDR